MNFDAAIRAHTQWKARLAGYANNPDHSIDPDQLGRDNCCELGKWIYAEGKRFTHMPELTALKATHAEFHRLAAAVVRKIDTGEARDQDLLTGFKSEFGAMTQKLASQVTSLANKVT
jgi:hypothetical protein